MAVTLSLIGGAGWQFFDDNGVPLAGGKIFTYAAGTTTPLTTYTSRDGLTANTNPIILDAAGRTPQQIWATEGLLYKYVVKTSTDTLIRTWDNIGGTVVASDLAADLASTSNNNLGDALVGFKQSTPAGFISGAVGKTVNDKLQEIVSVKDFGAVGDGVTDDSAAMTACATYCSSSGASMYVPAGTYVVTYNAINPPLTEGKNFCIFGDGPTSILKGMDGVFTGDFRHIIRLAPSSNIERIEVRDLFIDQNARGSTPPPSPFDYQRSAAVLMAANPGYTQQIFSISNVTFKDPVGDGVFIAHNATATLEYCDIRDIVEIDRTRVRNTITISRLPINTTIRNISGYAIKVEPNSVPTQQVRMEISDCIISLSFAVDLFSETATYPGILFVNNVTAGTSLSVAGAVVCMTNCSGTVIENDGRAVSDLLDGSIITNVRFLLPYNPVTNSITAFNPHYSSETVRGYIIFNACSFVIDSIDDTITPTGYCVYSLSVSSSATAWRRRYTMSNCYFDPRAEYGIYLYRNGYWQLNNNQYGGRVAAIQVASSASRVVDATINGGNFSRVSGAIMSGSFFNVNQTTDIVHIRMTGTWSNVSTPLVVNASGNVTNANYFTDNSRVVPLAAIPTAAIVGDTIRLTATALGAGKDYICTTSSATVPTIRVIRQAGIKRDTTANRPTMTANDIGAMYMDTTLDADGLPIWWNGTAWINSSGAVV